MSFSTFTDLLTVAKRFQELQEPVVLVGGYAAFLLVDDRYRTNLRTTEDVDYVFKASTPSEYYRLSERMRDLGFSECTDDGAPICRWVVDGVRVDVMPHNPDSLGFSNRWYLQDPLVVELEPGLPVSVVNPLVFLGTKFEALANRGDKNLIGDTDLEDIITVIAYGKDVLPELADADPVLRTYLQGQAKNLLLRNNLTELVSGCLFGDHQSQERIPRVIDALRLVETGAVVTLSQEHLELLNKSTLTSGKGGHQSYFRDLKRQRFGNRQVISLEQIERAEQRLKTLRSAGTWQAAYSVVLYYFS